MSGQVRLTIRLTNCSRGTAGRRVLLALAGRERQSEAEMQRDQPRRDAEASAENWKDSAEAPSPVRDDDDARAEQRGHCVQPSAQDVGDVPEQQVADHPA